MKEHPIIFSGTMVRAILEGRKTMTRRIVKPQPEAHLSQIVDSELWTYTECEREWKCSYGQPGDHLWVRETWCRTGAGITQYRADNKTGQPYWEALKWKPSTHMPRWASRITLEITSVRVERLQEISEEDAINEGLIPYGDKYWEVPGDPPIFYENARKAFFYLWESINGKDSWDPNLWVWVVTFKRI